MEMLVRARQNKRNMFEKKKIVVTLFVSLSGFISRVRLSILESRHFLHFISPYPPPHFTVYPAHFSVKYAARETLVGVVGIKTTVRSLYSLLLLISRTCTLTTRSQFLSSPCHCNSGLFTPPFSSSLQNTCIYSIMNSIPPVRQSNLSAKFAQRLRSP